MKRTSMLIIGTCSLASCLVTSCRSGNGSVWDDNVSSGNYRGNVQSLWGHQEEESDAEFFGPNNEDFIGLKDEDLRNQFADGAVPQPKESPGESGSKIPGIDEFYKASGSESAVFKTVYFNTDDHILRGKDYTAIIDKIAAYLKSNPDIYLFVSGHCDERAPEAYNLSLGARRANYIRTLLVQKGVDSEKIHTVSYGKERPVDLGHNAEAWAKNRRGEFRIYHRR